MQINQTFGGLHWMNLEVLLILGNTGKPNLSSMRCVKLTLTKFSSNIRILRVREMRGSSFVQIMFLVAFGENWVGTFANLVRTLFLTRIKNKQMTKQRSGCTESKKTIEFTPLFLNVCQCVLVVL